MDTFSSFFMLAAMAFVLGLRHGLDLDHLAIIDSISRTVKDNTSLSKWVGFFFSLGHGMVVIILSLIIGNGLIQTNFPQWLESLGKWISIIFLLLFGLITLYKVLCPGTSQSMELPSGLRAYFFKKYSGEQAHPLWIMLIGALFALSFDTFTQVALFSISMKVMAGWIFSLFLGVLFMLGMMTSDGLNGFFIASVIQRTDKYSAVFAKLFGLSIAAFGIVLACMEIVL